MIKNFYTQREWDRVVGWGTVPVEYDANLNKTWIADAPSDCYNITITVTFNKKETKYGVYSQSSKTTESSNHDS